MSLHPEFPYPVYLVLSERECRYHHWLKIAEQAIQGGVDIIQLREKDLDEKQLLDRATQLKDLTDSYDIPLVINDFPDIAAEVSAWAVHVGRSDLTPGEIYARYHQRLKIGWSLELASQLQDRQMQWVHHLGVSPIHDTPTKTDTITTWGLDGLERIGKMTSYPLIAIGGINSGNAKSIYQAGAHSVAVVSTICASRDPKKAAADLKQQWRQTANR
ncbi:MAG: thiamine phosphate synthase [Sphingobacterium sp.]